MPAVAEIPRIPKTDKQRDRRERILASARRAFAEDPFHEVLMEDVATDAGVGKGTVYRYFPDKESLYFAVIFDGLAQLQGQIRATPADSDDLPAAITNLIRTLISFFTENRLFFQLMNQEDSRSPGENPNRARWWEERTKLIEAIVVVLDRGRRLGRLDVRHPETEAQILMGMVRSVLVHGKGLSPDDMTQEISRIYLNGMASKMESGAAE